MRFPTTRLVPVALACVSALAVCACTGGDGRASRPGAAGSPDGADAIVIWADGNRADGIESFIRDLKPGHGVNVQVKTVETDLQDALIAASRAGQAPDIVVGVHNWIGNLSQAGVIEPVDLSSSQRHKFASIAIRAVTYNDKLYGVPFAIENLALYRNTELAPDAPQTIEETIAVGNQLKRAGRVREAMSMPVGAAGDAYHLLPLYTSGGAYLFGTTEAGDLDMSDLGLLKPEATTAFAKIASLGEQGSGGLKRSIGVGNAVSLFTTSQTPFLISGPQALSAVRRAGLGYAISPVPGFYDGKPALSFVTVPSFFVTSKGRNKALAQRFVRTYLTRPALPVALYEGQPEPPALTAAFNQVVTEDPAMRPLLDAGRGGVILPAVGNLAALLDPMARAEAAIVAGAEVRTTVAAAGSEMAIRMK